MTATLNPVPLDQRALLIRLSIRQWSGRKLDKKVTLDINSTNLAAPDAGRFNKLLIPREALMPCGHLATMARTLVDRNSLPWTYDGTRIATIEAYEGIMAAIGHIRNQFLDAAEELIQSMPDHIAQAPSRLGKMWNPADYPSTEKLRQSYGFDVEVMPVPTADDFRVQGIADLESIKVDIERRINERVGIAVSDAWQRIHDTCADVADRLVAYETSTGRQGAFRNSIMGNVTALADALPALNLTGDPRLAAMAEDLRHRLAAYDPDELRKHSYAREEVLRTARAMQTEAAKMVGENNPFGQSPATSFADMGVIQ